MVKKGTDPKRFGNRPQTIWEPTPDDWEPTPDDQTIKGGFIMYKKVELKDGFVGMEREVAEM